MKGRQVKKDKLTQLLKIEGYANVGDAMADSTIDSVSPGICTNEGCDYTTTVEPDCDSGVCEDCGTPSVISLAELLYRTVV